MRYSFSSCQLVQFVASYFDFSEGVLSDKTPIAKQNHPARKKSPPKGVKYPSHVYASCVERKYKLPQNKIIPAMKFIPAKPTSQFLNRSVKIPVSIKAIV